jgi:phenylpropionate dioxygenase-like ring-hydroxylating dioxygenase large terminal subunit
MGVTWQLLKHYDITAYNRGYALTAENNRRNPDTAHAEFVHTGTQQETAEHATPNKTDKNASSTANSGNPKAAALSVAANST